MLLRIHGMLYLLTVGTLRIVWRVKSAETSRRDEEQLQCKLGTDLEVELWQNKSRFSVRNVLSI